MHLYENAKSYEDIDMKCYDMTNSHPMKPFIGFYYFVQVCGSNWI